MSLCNSCVFQHSSQGKILYTKIQPHAGCFVEFPHKIVVSSAARNKWKKYLMTCANMIRCCWQYPWHWHCVDIGVDAVHVMFLNFQHYIVEVDKAMVVSVIAKACEENGHTDEEVCAMIQAAALHWWEFWNDTFALVEKKTHCQHTKCLRLYYQWTKHALASSFTQNWTNQWHHYDHDILFKKLPIYLTLKGETSS